MSGASLSILGSLALPLNFACHIIIFIGGLYIAIHSRLIPTWLRTCLWYIGCSSFFIAITIILDWIFGSQFELSYDRVGFFGEILFNCWVATTTIIFFFKTVSTDITHSKFRKH